MGPISVWTIWGEHVRRHLCILTGLTLVGGGMPGRQAAAAPTASEVVASEGPDALAKTMFREQRYPEAALEFERLWFAQRTPKYLFNAAMAREMMGHELQAFVHLQVFIGLPGLAEAEIARAKDRIQGLRERTVKLRVRVAPADLPAGALALNARRLSGIAGHATPVEVHLDGATVAALAVPGAPGAYDLPVEVGRWELEFTSDGYGPGRTSLHAMRGPTSQNVVRLERLVDTVEVTAEFTPEAALEAGIDVSLQGPAPEKVTRKRVERSPVTWRLKPGAWTLEANAAGFKPVRTAFTAGAEPVRMEVQLTQAPRKGRRLALGLGVAGGVMAVAGTVMLGILGSDWKGAKKELLDETENVDGSAEAWESASNRMRRDWEVTNAGAGILGVGLGAGLGSLATFARRRRPIWIVEISGGAAIAVGAAIGYDFALERFDTAYNIVRDAKKKQGAGEWSGRGRSNGNLNRTHGEGIAGGLLIGVGVGVAVSGLVGLLYDLRGEIRSRRTTIFPYSKADGAGVVLRGYF